MTEHNKAEPDLPPRAEALAAAPWHAVSEADFGAAARVPTMLAPEERRLYLWLAEHWASGAGALVDLGCFLGGSTALLAEGQRRAGRAAPVHGYDAFRISDWLKEKYLAPAGIAPFEGDWMLPLVEELLAPWGETVSLHPGRLEEQQWDGGPIEILVMDASKTTFSMDRMAKIFFPSLIPGRSLVVQQDYLHWKQPWIAVQMERMADCFTPLAHCPRDTVVFLCTRPIDRAALEHGHCGSLSDAEMLEMLARARRRLARFQIDARMRRLERALALNPGARNAPSMKIRP
ncbi:MAG: hypothetical protein D6811_01435 [Alphaproteobacteria bacterium]|nr:MAG: hypothetical protein D6811_01435 [Alphaproteobacteria bacterium]